jgi:peptidoglycan/LPS O-acetylase OafA/YrhL
VGVSWPLHIMYRRDAISPRFDAAPTSMIDAPPSAPTRGVSSKRHYVALDGLRGLAILLVFFFHYGDLSHSSSGVLRFVGLVKDGGWMGVDLFFVLSGFLITGILLDSRQHPRYFRKFYIRRALRLFPVFYGVAALLLLLTPYFHLDWRPAQAWYLFYAANFVQLHDFSLSFVGPFKLMHLWSLALEEQFYFVWPLAVLLIRDRLSLLKVAIGIVIVAPVLRIVLVNLHVSALVIYYQLPTRMDGFAVGGVLALLVREHDLAVLAKPCKIIFPACVCILAGLAMTRGTLRFTDPWMIQVGYSTLAIMFGSLLILALRPEGLVSRVFNWSLLRFYGLISYGFYVYHELLHNLTKPLYNAYVEHLHSLAIAGVLYTASVLAIITGLSFVSYRYFEAPFLRLKLKFQ